MAPLIHLTKKVKFKWDEKCEIAFGKIKQALVQAPILAYHTSEDTLVRHKCKCPFCLSGLIASPTW